MYGTDHVQFFFLTCGFDLGDKISRRPAAAQYQHVNVKVATIPYSGGELMLFV